MAATEADILIKYMKPQLPHFNDFSVSGLKFWLPHFGQNLKTSE
jgi:hypothetical protein